MATGNALPITDFTRAVAEILRAEMGRRSIKAAELHRVAKAELQVIETDFSYSTVNRITKGDLAPTTDHLVALCSSLGLSVAAVLQDAEAVVGARRARHRESARG